MLESDLAELYGVETKRLNEQVKRNLDRFPEDFMFQLTETEFENLKSQIATSSWGGRLTLPYVFTEHGVLMLSSVLNSDLAIKVNIQIMRVYTKIRNMLATHQDLLLKFEQFETKLTDHDDKIMLIFEYLKQLEKSKQEELEYRNRQQIGYKSKKGK
ncbi:MAG: ORF6N domain-containing protein [Bacteroidota bacterium]